MKKNDLQDAEGGAKKFVYSGQKKKKGLFGEEDDINQQWNFTPQQRNPQHPGNQFDLEDVWSIRKNVGVNKHSIAPDPTGGSFWERGAGKGFYSRHGGLANDDNEVNAISLTQGTNYSQTGRTFSYAYGATGNAAPVRPSPNNFNNQPTTNNTMPNNRNSGMGGNRAGPVASRYQGPVQSTGWNNRHF